MRNFDIIKQYGIRPWQNPGMTSNSQNGYTAVSADGCTTITPYLSFRDFSNTDAPIIDWSIYASYGHIDYPQLNFPKDRVIFINRIYYPVNGGNFGWGAPNTSVWTVYGYFNNAQVFSQVGYVSNVIDITPVRCDSVKVVENNLASPDYAGWSPFKFSGYEMG